MSNVCYVGHVVRFGLSDNGSAVLKEEERRGEEPDARRSGDVEKRQVCVCVCFCFFFFKQKTAYEIRLSLVGSEMCIRGGS